MNKQLITVLFAGFFALTGAKHIVAAEYVVNEGDTLWQISQSQGLTMAELQEKNDLQSSTIYPGQTLAISEQTMQYTVKKGDTLSEIAREFDMTVQDLRELNGISGTYIFPGQTMKVNGENEQQADAQYSESEKALLARLVHAESQGESFEGKTAVAAVVLNRVRSDHFPSSIRDVIYETYENGNIYAFEPVQNGQINQKADNSSIKAVEAAIRGNDPTNGALFFFNPETSQSDWVDSLTINQRIGNHVFASD